MITPEDGNGKDVMAQNIHSAFNLDDIKEGDEVKFVSNKKGVIVAIQKKQYSFLFFSSLFGGIFLKKVPLFGYKN